MSQYQQLASKISDLEKERRELLKTIDRLDKECFELSSSVERLENVLTKMVNTSFHELNMDIDYICLKRNISAEEKFEINCLPFEAQREFMRTGKVQSIQEYHANLLRILHVEEDEMKEYPIEITIHLLEKYASMGDLSVIPEILNKK